MARLKGPEPGPLPFRPWGLICCICFEGLTPDTCAIDEEGQRWDVCRGRCAADSGLVEARPDLEAAVKGWEVVEEAAAQGGWDDDPQEEAP